MLENSAISQDFLCLIVKVFFHISISFDRYTDKFSQSCRKKCVILPNRVIAETQSIFRQLLGYHW